MNRFEYQRPSTVDDAVAALARPGAMALAGGTNLVDLLKYEVIKPVVVVDIGRLPLRQIAQVDGDVLRLGALVTNADAAYDERVLRHAPLLSSALLAGASAQLRNAATVGGNLLQRTRCFYFYDPQTPCNKRDPGSGCAANGGLNRMHAILGASSACVAVNPSDMCVALAALEARVNVQGPRGARIIPFENFHRLPGDAPEKDSTLAADEIVLSVDIPRNDFGTHYTYIKIRDRCSYAFALVSVAVGLVIEGGRVRHCRLALGGVAHKPWRNEKAEALLEGRVPDAAAFAAVADAMLEGAVALPGNAFKLDLARRAIVRALQQAVAGTPQQQADKRIR